MRPDLRAEHLGDVKKVVVRVAVGGVDGDGAVGAIATGAAIGEGEDIGGLEGRRRVAAVATVVAAQLGRVRREELVEDPLEAVVLDVARVGDGDGLAIGAEGELLGVGLAAGSGGGAVRVRRSLSLRARQLCRATIEVAVSLVIAARAGVDGLPHVSVLLLGLVLAFAAEESPFQLGGLSELGRVAAGLVERALAALKVVLAVAQAKLLTDAELHERAPGEELSLAVLASVDRGPPDVGLSLLLGLLRRPVLVGVGGELGVDDRGDLLGQVLVGGLGSEGNLVGKPVTQRVLGGSTAEERLCLLDVPLVGYGLATLLLDVPLDPDVGPPIVGDVGLSDEEMVDPLYLGGVGGDDAQSRWDAPLRLLEVPCPVVEGVIVEKRRRASENKVRRGVDRDRALFLGVLDGWKLLEDGNPVVLAVPEEPREVRREVLEAEFDHVRKPL